MDPDKRIEALEKQVEELTGLVKQLRGEDRSAKGHRLSKLEAALHRKREKKVAKKVARQQPPKPELRERLGKALGGDPDEAIEIKLGAIWLSRFMVIIGMTALALGARYTVITEDIGPMQKAGIGYGIAAICLVYGLFFNKKEDFFAQAILGCGLASLYFTTYAIFFIPEMRLSEAYNIGLPLLLVCFLLLAAVAHWRRSQTVAGIGLFLVQYTIVVSCMQAPTMYSLSHALMTCTVLALFTFIFHFLHRWLLFSWASLIGTLLVYLLFFLRQPEQLTMSPQQYFWFSNGFLTLIYVLFTMTCIVDARKTGEYRKTVASMSGVNSFVYFALTWFAIRAHYPEYEWAFRSGFAGMLLFFAIFTETTGPRRNYLFQIFIAKVVIMFTLALQSTLSGEKLLVAMSIECLALGFSFKRSGIVIFKILGLCMAMIVFVGCLASSKLSGTVPIGALAIKASWFSAIGCSFIFCSVAWFYERFVRRLRPEQRVVSGQWFLADSIIDFQGRTMALIHATGAALILLVITIMEFGEEPFLPYVLAGEAVILAALGLMLMTPEIEIGGVLLLVAAHLCYHAFLWTRIRPDFLTQDNFAPYTIIVAIFTFGGAYAWERYLKRFFHPAHAWEHHVIAALPYLAATVMLTTLAERQCTDLQLPAVQGGLAVLLLLVGAVTAYPGVKASGVLALGLAVRHYFLGLVNIEAPTHQQPDFLLYACLFVSACVASERLFVILQRYEKEPSHFENHLRTVIVGLILLLGIQSLFEWSTETFRIFHLLTFAVIMIVLGAIFRESRYRWGAFFLFGVSIFWVFIYALRLSPGYQFLSFAVFAAILLPISWIYSRYRMKKASSRDSEDAEDNQDEG